MPKPKSKPKPVSTALTEAQLAVRDGDTSALETWAKEVESAGNTEAAKVIRDFPGLRDYISGHLTKQRESWPDVGVSLIHYDDRSYWYLGDWDMDESTAEYPSHWPHMIGLLVIHWNVYYPGVEWLARQLQLQLVKFNGSRPSTRRSLVTQFALHEGQHLSPLEPDDELSMVFLTPYVPPKVAGPGECPKCTGYGRVTCEVCGGNAFVVVNDEEQDCEKCDCLGSYNCPACSGSGKLPKAKSATTKAKSKPKKAAPKRKPPAKPKTAAKGKAKPTAKKKPKT